MRHTIFAAIMIVIYIAHLAGCNRPTSPHLVDPGQLSPAPLETDIVDSPGIFENSPTESGDIPSQPVGQSLADALSGWEDTCPDSALVGNSNQNLLNGGGFAENSSTIFYSPNEIYYNFTSNAFYRIQNSGEFTPVQLTDDNAFFINIVDGWIYYISKAYYLDEETEWPRFLSQGIYKVKSDGTARICILEDSSIRSMIVINTFIYYVNDAGQVFRMNLDATGIKLLFTGSQSSSQINYTLQYSRGYLYLVYTMEANKPEAKYVLSRINLAEEAEVPEYLELASPCKPGRYNSHCLVDNGWIYYDTEDGLVVRDFSGERQVVAIKGIISSFAIANQDIYVYMGPHSYEKKRFIQKLNVKNGMISTISIDADGELTTVHLLGATKDYIVYCENDNGADTFNTHFMRFDGTDDVLLPF